MKAPLTKTFLVVTGLGCAFAVGRFSAPSPPHAEDVDPGRMQNEEAGQPNRRITTSPALTDPSMNSLPTDGVEFQAETQPLDVHPLNDVRTPGEMYREAMRHDDVLTRRASLSMAALSANPEDIPSLISAYEHRPPGGDSMYAVMALMTAWGKFDGPAAVVYAETNLGGWQARYGAESAMQTWVEHNPESAMDWLSTQEQPETKEWYPGVIAALSTMDLPLAGTMMNEMEYGRLRGRAADRVLDAYQRMGIQNMLGYVEAVDDARLKVGLERKAAVRLAAEAPSEYTDWVLGIEDEKSRKGALRSYLQRWAGPDPEAALRFVQEIENSELQDSGLDTVLRSWLREDVAAAVEWVNDLDQGRKRDRSLKQVTSQLMHSQPDVALEYALQISDGKSRLASVKQITERWVQRDAEGAAKVLGEDVVKATQAAMQARRKGTQR